MSTALAQEAGFEAGRNAGLRKGLMALLLGIGFAWSLAASGAESGSAAVGDWHDGPGFRYVELALAKGGRTGFTAMAPGRTGVWFTNVLADRTVATNRVYENGSGVALGDVDGDGWCDVYFCRMEGANALYRNLGDWRFAEVPDAGGAACRGQYSTGAAFADVDGDGDLDLLVNAIGGGTKLFRNDGRGGLAEVTTTRLVRRYAATSMALADVDGDDDLDLYVTNYRTDTYRDRPPGVTVEARMVGGKVVVTPEDRFVPVPSTMGAGAVEVIELGERDFLYMNDGQCGFAPASWTSGAFVDEDGRALASPPRDWGLSVLLRDLNGDRAPDIHVCNDFFQSPDRIWFNEGSRRFRAAPRTAFRNMSVSSMASDAADLDRDGDDDLLVVDMLSRRHRDRQRQRPDLMQGRVRQAVEDPDARPEVPRNTLYLNRGDGSYAEIAQLSGLAATEWSWSPVFLDVDLDGFEDLLVANGNHHDVQDADVIREIARVRERETPEARLARFPRLHTANLAYRNRGDLTFEEVGAAWGFAWEGVSQGMALADLDRDGDLDVVLNNLNAGALLYRNDTSAPRVAVRLAGRAPNTRGIGARIEVFGGPVPVQGQEMTCGGRYLSADEALRVFAAASAGAPLRIEVTWRNGRRSRVDAVAANRLYEIREPEASTPAPPATEGTGAPAWFADVGAWLGHRHVDVPHDDFGRQPLASHRWSCSGPGVAWLASPEHGREDLVIGGGRGGRLARFRWTGKGGFERDEGPELERDQTGMAAWTPDGTNSVLLVASTNDEETDGRASTVQILMPGSTTCRESGATLDAGAGPVAVGDVDGDGDLDVFVGGRLAGGRYPEPVSSRIYLNEAGRLVPDARFARAGDRLGLANGALFADLDEDGRDELIVATHWGPIRVWRWVPGGWQETTRDWGLDRYRGWWNGVVAGDFDGDGHLDLAASNWGRNTPYQAWLGKPIVAWFKDFDDDGVVEVLETHVDPETGKRVPWRDFETVVAALPFVRARMPTFRAYAESSVAELLGAEVEGVATCEIDLLDSVVFLHRAGRFEARALPVEAQFAPAFGLVVADFNGDGAEDLFLAQNFFGVTAEVSRYDGGLGLLLAGDGRGSFRALTPRESGIRLTGEQRGCAVADFDGDGRPDLAVGQNAGPTGLFRNRSGGPPGVSVRLAGPPGNPRGVGAVVRLIHGARSGPGRHVAAGGGHASQSSLVSLLARPDKVTAVEVRWPGGRTSRMTLSDDAREILVESPDFRSPSGDSKTAR